VLTPTLRQGVNRALRWLMPSGNLGDTLLLSSVLMTGFEQTGERVGIVRVPPHASLFLDHPAVEQIAWFDVARFPVQRTDYWNLSFPDVPGATRPFGRLSVLLYGRAYATERIFAPLSETDRAVVQSLPFQGAPILLAPVGDSPRREWPRAAWAELARRLATEFPGVPIVQVGVPGVPPVAGTFNLTGKLAPRENLAVLATARACVSVDPFFSLGASMHGVPCVPLHGPTSAAVYARPEHAPIGGPSPCETACLDAGREAGMHPCEKANPCMGRIDPAAVAALVARVAREPGAAPAELPRA
jgi:hypothetical protein